MASDFHTHNKSACTRALISDTALLAEKLVSCQFHPWTMPNQFDAAKLPNVTGFAAIGETGLDKLRGPSMNIQKQYFHALLQTASETDKPVVVHAVKAFQELFEILKHYDLRIMLHGFRSNVQILDELWRRKITVSFHHSVLSDAAIMAKLKNPGGRFGFETDDDMNVNIETVIQKAADISEVKNMEKITDQNFCDFMEI